VAPARSRRRDCLGSVSGECGDGARPCVVVEALMGAREELCVVGWPKA
jgi:hypothetical protein